MIGGGGASVHASAVMVGTRAILIRGASGTGKSRLAFDLILAGRCGQIAPAVLVGDDRVYLEARRGQLIVSAAGELAGKIEIRGLGIRSCEHAEEAVVGLIVDLSALDAGRLPEPASLMAEVCGVAVPRLPVGAGYAALPLVLAALTTQSSPSGNPAAVV
jgi:serine kinase of HPr protein (carbohydrate metabolism regulator)